MGLKSALFWFSFVLFLGVSVRLLDLPDETVLRAMIIDWFALYGLWVTLVGSLIETILFVGFYFPGSLIIFMSVALAPSAIAATKAVILVDIGMMVGYSINYWLGKHGWHRLFLKLGMKEGLQNAERKMRANGVKYIFLTFWNPGLAAFSSTAAGMLKLPYERFVTIAAGSLLVWNTMWGIVVYSIGEAAIQLVTFKFIIWVIVAWVVYELVLWFIRRKRVRKKSATEFEGQPDARHSAERTEDDR